MIVNSLLALFTGFIYLHKNSLLEKLDASTIDPLSEVEQNVTFDDSARGPVHDVSATLDSTRHGAFISDADLGDFFRRPSLIQSSTWTVGSDLFTSFNPWQIFFGQAQAVEKLAHFQLMRCTLHVKVVLNGSPFHYGRAMYSYCPLPRWNMMHRPYSQSYPENIRLSQRPHIYIDPCLSQGGEMVLPMFWFKDSLNIPGGDVGELGIITLSTMTLLKHANDATSDITLRVFAWAEDFQVSVLTSNRPFSEVNPLPVIDILPLSDEYTLGPVSRVAATVANVARALVPVIGPYARATELGAVAMGKMATLFGYSTPPILDLTLMRPTYKRSFAVTNAPDDLFKLSLDIKQEISIDPRLSGAGTEDELALSHITQIESYIAKFIWPRSEATNALLWNVRVDPMIPTQFDNRYYYPAVSYASIPFRHWRGSLKYRFQIVASAFHKGRLRFVYDPNYTNPDPQHNLVYSAIVDISTTKDFTLCVGWGQAEAYRERLPLGLTTEYYNELELVAEFPYATNGTMSVFVENELTTPNSTIDNDIDILVFLSACDDFELQEPYSEDMQRQSVLGPEPDDVEASIDTSNIEPLALPDYSSSPILAPDQAPVMTTMGSSLPDSPNSLVYFGEKIKSFRQLIRRYSYSQSLNPPSASPNNIVQWIHSYMPADPGYLRSPIIWGVYDAGGKPGSVAQMTSLRFATLAFAAYKGGVRWFYDGAMAADSQAAQTLLFRRINNRISLQNPIAFTAPAATYTNQWRGRVIPNMWDGAAMTATRTNPGITFEVPFYSPYRFVPSGFLTQDGTSHFLPKVQGMYNARVGINAYLDMYVCGAEDFTCHFFLGCPPLRNTLVPLA